MQVLDVSEERVWIEVAGQRIAIVDDGDAILVGAATGEGIDIHWYDGQELRVSVSSRLDNSDYGDREDG